MSQLADFSCTPLAYGKRDTCRTAPRAATATIRNKREQHIQPIGKKETVWGWCKTDSDWSESKEYNWRAESGDYTS